MFPGGDPFHKPSKGGRLQNKDYTKFIKWTPLKITIFVFWLVVPYVGIVIAVAKAISIGAAIPLIIIPFFLAALLGLVYGIGLLGRAKPQRQKTTRSKR